MGSSLDIHAVILTEAGPAVGFGHLSRCIAIYDALQEVGGSPEIIVSGEVPPHIAEGRNARVAEWREPRLVRSLTACADVVVVDSYQADLDVYEAVADAPAVALFIDDTMRLRYPPGLVLNGSPDAPAFPYERGAGVTLLLGTRYQPLRREFWEIGDRKVSDRIERALIVFGGAGYGGLPGDVAALVTEALPGAAIDLVDSPRTASEIRDSMLAADVAVRAAGQTLYELAATGTPTVAVCVADNQIPQARAFERAGANCLAGLAKEPDLLERLAHCLRRLEGAEARRLMSSVARDAVDGWGALRVARACVGAALDARVTIREATLADEEALLGLANDPSVRAMSFSEARIEPDEHHEWLFAKVSDPATLLVVLVDSNRLAGQARFDVVGSEAVVSVALDRRYRGLGLGPAFLTGAEAMLRVKHPGVRVLVARIKSANAASLRLFEQVGYETGVGFSNQDGTVELRRQLQD